MRRLILALIAIVATLGIAELGHACSSLGSSVNIETFECGPCPDDPKQQGTQIPIFVATGRLQLSNRRAAPTLGSIVVELQKKIDRRYTPIARQVLNEMGDPMVHTCEGSFAQLPMSGRLVLTNSARQELTFADVKNLPEGRVTLHYLATFAGITNLDLGERVRIRVYTTAIGVHASRLCSVDADGDGSDDADVKTLRFQRTIRVPAIATLLTPPTT